MQLDRKLRSSNGEFHCSTVFAQTSTSSCHARTFRFTALRRGSNNRSPKNIRCSFTDIHVVAAQLLVKSVPPTEPLVPHAAVEATLRHPFRMEGKDSSRKRKLATQGKDSALGQNKLTLQRRLELMKRLEDGAKVSDVASDFNVTTQYVYKLRKSESETVLKRVRELGINPSCFRTTVPKYHDLDCRLMEWIEIARTRYEASLTTCNFG